MAENEEREEREWRREALLLALVMGAIAGIMIWRGWEEVRSFDAETFSYLSDITTTLVNLGVLYAALVRGRSLVKWVLRQWERLVATSPRIRAMFISLWPRSSAAKPEASAAARESEAGVADEVAPVSSRDQPPPELGSQAGDRIDGAEVAERGKLLKRLGWPVLMLLAFVGAMVGVVLLANSLLNAWEIVSQPRDEQPAVEQPATPEQPTSAESNTQDYLVPFRTPRVSCRLIARSFSPSRDGGDYVQIVELNSLTDECRIAFGTTIKLPANWDASQPLN